MRSKPKTLTVDQVRARLVAAIEAAGSQAAFAKRIKVSGAYLNDVLRGKRDFTKAVLEPLGIKRETIYVEVGK